MHALDLDTFVWSPISDAPGPTRAGTTLVTVEDTLVRFGGWCGYELGNKLEMFDTHDYSWMYDEDMMVEGGEDGPGGRSVHSFVAVNGPRYKYYQVVAVMSHGERETNSELRRNGAGYVSPKQ